jgi:iron complex outermembrane receptor protein
MKKSFIILLLNVSFLFAQKEISGVVKDVRINITGVNIVEKGTQMGFNRFGWILQD